MSIGIYKITNPKGRIYIGQSINIERRFKKYQRVYYFSQPRLYRSLKKYGPGNHNFEIIEQCGIKELNIKERYWQDFYDVIGNKGLNCSLTSTNDKSGEQSLETKLKIGNPQIGKIVSNETKLKMKIAASKRVKKVIKPKVERQIMLDLWISLNTSSILC